MRLARLLRGIAARGLSRRWSRRSRRRPSRLVELTDRLGRLRDALTVADILNRLLEETGYLRWAELRAQRDGSPRALLNLRKVFQLAARFERDLALAGIGDFVRHLDQVIDAELPVGEAAEEVGDRPTRSRC